MNILSSLSFQLKWNSSNWCYSRNDAKQKQKITDSMVQLMFFVINCIIFSSECYLICTWSNDSLIFVCCCVNGIWCVFSLILIASKNKLWKNIGRGMASRLIFFLCVPCRRHRFLLQFVYARVCCAPSHTNEQTQTIHLCVPVRCAMQNADFILCNCNWQSMLHWSAHTLTHHHARWRYRNDTA